MNPPPTHLLRLYVAGQGAVSQRAVEDLRRLCKEALGGACELEVVDVLAQPEAAEAANILALPTVVRERPLPARRVIGDLGDRERVLEGLDLHVARDVAKKGDAP